MVGHPSCVLSPQLTPPPWGSLWCQSVLTSQKALSCFKNSSPTLHPRLLWTPVLNQVTQLDPPRRYLALTSSLLPGVESTRLSPLIPPDRFCYREMCPKVVLLKFHCYRHVHGVLLPQEVRSFSLELKKEINNCLLQSLRSA